MKTHNYSWIKWLLITMIILLVGFFLSPLWLVIFLMALLLGGVGLTLGLSLGGLGLIFGGLIALAVILVILFVGLIVGIPLLIVALIGLAIGGFKNNWNWHNLVADNLVINDDQDLSDPVIKDLVPFDTIHLNANVQVEIQAGDHFQVVIQNAKSFNITATVNDRCLTIDESTHGSRDEHHTRFFNFAINLNRVTLGKITIYISRDHILQAIDQSHQNQFITINHVKINHNLQLHGDVQLNQVHADGIDIKTADHLVQINDGHFDQTVSNLRIDNGNVQIKNCSFKRLDKLTLADGNLAIINTITASGTTKLRVNDGRINLINNHWDELNVKFADGTLHFESQKLNGTFSIKGNDASIDGVLLPDDNVHIHVECNDGMAQVDPSVNHDDADQLYYFVVNDGNVIIR